MMIPLDLDAGSDIKFTGHDFLQVVFSFQTPRRYPQEISEILHLFDMMTPYLTLKM